MYNSMDMEKIVIFLILFSCVTICPAFPQEDSDRAQALRQLDEEVNGAKRLKNTVPALSERQIDEDCAPLWLDDPFYGPCDGLEDEWEYRRMEEER